MLRRPASRALWWTRRASPSSGPRCLSRARAQGTSTDPAGHFALTVPAPAASRLVVNFLGYEPQTLHVGSRREFEITLRESSAEIESVVGDGPGHQTLRESPGLHGRAGQGRGRYAGQGRETSSTPCRQGRGCGHQPVLVGRGRRHAGHHAWHEVHHADLERLYVVDGVPSSARAARAAWSSTRGVPRSPSRT